MPPSAMTAVSYTHLQPGDIYGAQMEVTPVRFLRPEAKFPSLDALKSQLALDARQAAEVLERAE